jgi:ABC-type dipeptide/oligopeptide/nickel transport system permease subunit
MATTTSELPTGTTNPLIDEDIGLLRRIWRGRIWYGTEWYITLFGGAILVTIIIVTILAPILAPYDPNKFIGGIFIPPGGGKQAVLIRSGEQPITSILELSGQNVGVQRNANGNKVAVEFELEYTRYQTEDELLDALSIEEVDVILVSEGAVEEILAQHPHIEMTADGIGRRFILGTDHLGRDILSRLIWGARTILGVAILSALFSIAYDG